MATSKIEDFRDMLGNMPDEKVADLAEVTVQTVKRWRAKLDIGAFEGVPGVDPALVVGLQAAKAGVDEAVEQVRQERRAKEQAPPAVRVVRKRKLASWPFGWAPGVPHQLGTYDVYTGEKAAWLWEHHRDVCAPFPPAE